MIMDTITQVGVLLLGVTSIWMCGLRDQRVARWGFVVGLCSQPFWFYTTIAHEQYFIFVASLLYSASWVNWVRNHFFRGQK